MVGRIKSFGRVAAVATYIVFMAAIGAWQAAGFAHPEALDLQSGHVVIETADLKPHFGLAEMNSGGRSTAVPEIQVADLKPHFGESVSSEVYEVLVA